MNRRNLPCISVRAYIPATMKQCTHRDWFGGRAGTPNAAAVHHKFGSDGAALECRSVAIQEIGSLI